MTINPKILFVGTLFLFLTYANLMAQDQENNDFEKTLQFIYVAHDPVVPVNRLTDCLQRYYDNAMSSDDYMVIFYMSNDVNPYVVQINTANDNRDDFPRLIDALQSENYHIVNTSFDLENTVKLLDTIDFVDPKTQEIKFGAVDWFFYVNSVFWLRRYNEEYISSLCFVMDVVKFGKSQFQIKFYYPKEDKMEVNKLSPFGTKNYSNIKYYSYPY